MTALIPAHRRAEKFAALVDSVSTAGANGREVQFLELVGALRSASATAPTPRADYVRDLRARLLAEADIALVPTDRKLVVPTRTGRRPRRMTAAAAALVIVGGTAGVSFAAQGSLPGDALYPVKRGIEQVHESLSFSDAARGRDLLQQADTRLSEVDLMLGNGGTDQAVAQSLASFTDSASSGARLLFTSYQADGDDTSVTSVRDFAGTEMGDLTALSRRAPRSLGPDFASAAQLLTAIDQQARVLCASCGARAPLTAPSDLSLSSEQVSLDHLLSVPSRTQTPAGTGGVADPSSEAAAAAGPSSSSRHTGKSHHQPAKTAPPDLRSLPGGSDASDQSSTPTGPGSAPSGNLLGGLLDSPSTGASTGTDPGGPGSLGGAVKKTVKDPVKKAVKDPVKRLVKQLGSPIPKP